MAKLSSLSPANNAVITTTSTTISALVGNVMKAPCTVYLEVSDSKNFSTIFYSTSKTANSGDTVSFPVSGFVQGNYYWRMRVEDGDIVSNYTSYRGIFVNIASTGRLSPDAIAVQTNLTGALTDIQDDPDAPDANWLNATSDTSAAVLRVSFPTPPTNLKTGAGLQQFNTYVRRSLSSSTAIPNATISLYEGGVLKTSGTATAVNTSTGMLLSYSWDAASLSDVTGANVELYITAPVAGSGGSRTTIDIGAVEWNYQVMGEVQDNAPADVAPAVVSDLVATATATDTENFVRLFWNEPLDSDFSHVEIVKDSVTVNTYQPNNNFGDGSVVAGQTYHFDVVAVDMAGNKSSAVGVDITVTKTSNTPIVSVTNISRTKISDEAGVNQSLITLKFDKNVIAWQLKALGVSHDTGVLVESGDILIAGTEVTATIDWNELNTEGLNRINIYGFDGAYWTPYDDVSQPVASSHNYTTFKYGASKYGKN